MKTIKIGTRESRLAVVQAEQVASAVRAALPDAVVELVTMKTTGDKILDRTLDQVGGKGLFVRELDEALITGRVDLCVHSYKDLPAGENPALPVVAVSARENPLDVLILPEGATLPDPGKPVGCSSQRRQVQLREIFPGQPVAPVRGNVLTRLEKLDRGEYSGLVLAAAGILRLGLWERVNRVFTAEELLPAGCQGILAVQGRAGEDYSYLNGFHDPAAWTASRAERAFIERLDCGCGAPVGVFGEVEGDSLRLRCMVASERGIYREELRGSAAECAQLGTELAEKMIERMGGICGKPE